jgi:DNA-binding response OmpR family regulator
MADLRVICTSGYVFSGQEEQGASYLQKPFTSRELLQKVKKALADETVAVD